MLFLPLFLLSLLPLLSSRSYCLDSKCPFKCCQDFYSCALTPDCSSPDSKPYTYPFPIGSSCQASSDCISDCCYAGSTCEQMSKCSALVGGVVGSIAGVFALVVVGFFMIRAMRKKRYDDLHHIAKSQNEQIVETAENSVLMGTEHAFDPNAYCQAKMNIAAVSSDGMPFKPEPLGNHNLIKTKFKVVTY